MEKVIFLDVDGVLNTGGSQRGLGANVVVPELCLLLARIVRETGAGIAESVVGQTPVLGIEAKDAEIRAWLKENQVARFAILDDSAHAGRGELAGSFFWISSIVGLQEMDVERIVRHLNG